MRVAVTASGLSGMGAPVQILDPNTTSTIAQTIQSVEGYYPGSVAYRNNNPGNLMYAGQPGAAMGTGGFARFSSYQDGLDALYNQIQLYAGRGLTIQQMMDKYAPAGIPGNDPVRYADTIASALGVSPDTALTDLSGQTSAGEVMAEAGMNVNPMSGDVNWALVGVIVVAALFGIAIVGR